jgi:hypothetical protein
VKRSKLFAVLNGYSSAKLAVIDAPAAGGDVNFNPGTVFPKKKVEPKLCPSLVGKLW